MEVGRLILPNKILPEFIMYTCQHTKITIYNSRNKIFENETSKHINHFMHRNHFIIQYYQVPVKIWVGIQLSDLEEDFIIGALFRSFIQVSSIFYCRACQLFRKQFMYIHKGLILPTTVMPTFVNCISKFCIRMG